MVKGGVHLRLLVSGAHLLEASVRSARDSRGWRGPREDPRRILAGLAIDARRDDPCEPL